MPRPVTENAVLSLVAQNGTYGYALRVEFANWAISGPMVPRASAIYKSLTALHDEGFIEPKDPAAPPTAGGRDRRTFVATEAGQRRITEWMDSEPESMEELWLRIGTARRQDVPALVRWVRKAERECLDRLQEIAVPDLDQLVLGDAHWRLVTRAVVETIEISEVEERVRLLREIRRTLQALREDPSSS